MPKALSSIAVAMALCASAPAAASVTINFGATVPIPGPTVNDFQPNLLAAGLTRLTTTGASIIANGPVDITFEFMGSESGFNDTFSTIGGLTLTENSAFTNNFASPVVIGTRTYAGGSLAGLLNFSSLGGAAATVGQDGFGIFLGPNTTSGSSFTTFWLGYDDQITGQDDNHDDLIIRATVKAAVPEPGTWAMMLLGFGMLGMSVRYRRRSGKLMQIA